MNTSSFEKCLEAARDYAQEQMHQSEPLRRLVRHLGEWLVSLSESAETANQPTEATSATASPAMKVPQDEVRSVQPTAPPISEIVTLKVGDMAVKVPVSGTEHEIHRAKASAEAEPAAPALVHPSITRGGGVDLKLIENRCRLKAESCRLYIEHRVVPQKLAVDEMIAQAKKMPNCFLWVFWRERAQPDDDVLRLIADCYDALAAAAGLVAFCIDESNGATGDDLEQAMQLFAEANSAMRIALEQTWLTAPDGDQDDAHQWLARETAMRRIYLERYMRLDDPADPAAAPSIVERAKQQRTRIEQRASARKQVDQLFKQIRYHARRVMDAAAGEAETHDWRKIAQAIDGLMAQGVKPNDRRITDALEPIRSRTWPAEAERSAAVDAAWAATAARQAANEASTETNEPTDTRSWSDQVLAVRQVLRGTSCVVIGGEPRPDAIERIRDAFELADVQWVRLSEHGSGEAMRAPIERPGTSVVLVLVKLAGHLHVEEARQYAQRAGKPCVLLTAGYNPEQIAFAIAEQVSGEMRPVEVNESL